LVILLALFIYINEVIRKTVGVCRDAHGLHSRTAERNTQMMCVKVVTLPNENLAVERQDQRSLAFVGSRHNNEPLPEVTVVGQPVSVFLLVLLGGFPEEAEGVLKFGKLDRVLELREWIKDVEGFARSHDLLADDRDAGREGICIDRFPQGQAAGRIVDTQFDLRDAQSCCAGITNLEVEVQGLDTAANFDDGVFRQGSKNGW